MKTHNCPICNTEIGDVEYICDACYQNYGYNRFNAEITARIDIIFDTDAEKIRNDFKRAVIMSKVSTVKLYDSGIDANDLELI